MRHELLIGITGTKGAGKTTVAEMLAELIPNIATVAWADALKDDVLAMANIAALTDLTRDDIEIHKSEVFGPWLQGYGAFMRRFVGPDYWINRWDERAPSRVIVSDCRHHNEVDYLKVHNGFLLYVTGESRWQGDTRSPQHESERYVVELGRRADYIIKNDGTLEQLRGQVEVLASILTEAGDYAGRAA